MTDTTETTTRPDASDFPAWLHVDQLPESDPALIERRHELGVRGVALARLLARWVREVRPHLIDLDLGFDVEQQRGGLRERIERYLGFAGIDYVSVLATEIDDMLEGRADDTEQLVRWVEGRPEIFGDDSATAAVSALVPELCAWVADFVTNPPKRARPDEETPADRVAMALIGIGEALGHNDLSSLPAEIPGPELVERDEADERADERARQMMDAAQRLVDQFGGTVIWRAEGASSIADTILAPVDPNWSRDLDAAARLVRSYGFCIASPDEVTPGRQGWIPTAADVARFSRVGR
jgi:hypothetical protein